MKKIILISILIFTSVLQLSFASHLTSQPQVQQFVKDTAAKYHYSTSYITNILNSARYVPSVIQHMNNPYEALPWAQYEPLFVTQDRVDGGLDYWNRSNKLVEWEEKEYNVPGNIILSIIGVETRYGEKMGDFRVLDALTTLAFYYPKRGTFFQKQLADFIALCNTYHLDPYSVTGSYAGAMGQAQFMPSSYLYYAVDFHGNGSPNLFSDQADVIFSIGNYLRQNGWEENQPIIVPAKISGDSFQHLAKKDTSPPAPPTMALSQLAKYGVFPANGYFDPNLKATLIAFQGARGPEYWLGFENFYVITRYNTSYQYAMAVYQLAQKLQAGWTMKQNNIKKT